MCYAHHAAMGAVLAQRGCAVPYPRPLRSGESMKSVRVLFAVVALSALPLVAVAAQGRGNSSVACRVAPQTAGSSGKVPPGQAKKCDPVPPPAPPPPPPPPPAAVPPPPPPPPAPVPPPPPPPPAPVPPPPPPPESPPTGINFANGIVFEDLNNDGV